jgi:predicted AlkP superfamily phosphohydrolase/phosphomutase
MMDRWMNSGDLPNLSRLLESSRTTRTRNPYALEAGSAWPVFHTGLMPGNQPLFDGQRYFDYESYTYRWHNADSVQPLLWERLSEQEKRCLIIDAPYARLNEGINGIMVLDFASHVAANGTVMELQSYPEWVREEILEAVGDDPTGGKTCDSRKLQSVADYRQFISDYISRIDKKASLTCHLLDRGPWDYVETVFTDLHCMGHRLWHIASPEHPEYNARLHRALGDPVRDGFIAIDAAVGRILDRLDEHTTVLLYVSHGMGPQNTGTGLLDRVLLSIDTGRPGSSSRRTTKSLLRDLWQGLPGELRGSPYLRAIRKPFAGAFSESTFLPDKRSRRFFEVYANNATGGVRLNIAGREAKGVVEPSEAPEILADLRAALLECRNAETGEPFVEDCVISREHYDGEYSDYLPDMLLPWNRSAPIRIVESPRVGVVSQQYDGYRTGDHTPFGRFFCSGPGIQPGLFHDDFHVADFVPSVLSFFSCDYDGLDGESSPILFGQQGEE